MARSAHQFQEISRDVKDEQKQKKQLIKKLMNFPQPIFLYFDFNIRMTKARIRLPAFLP
ncbi:unnamed protein product [Oikopleura dioica]|uniref:Uncharacterized protein n=1 Tax=Oikopleura dioica TaxID=34765 RepID=E4XG90_OIKDI|nr:unnamed protein product [Oikopleura dioica]